jgi:dolichol-phosphate mannosyltransferase
VSVAPPAGATWVILPTYDEAENVEAMLEAVLASLDGAGIEARVLVVDDASPDGTADLAEAVARRDTRVAVLRRPAKRGIGPAYRAGFHRALSEGAARIVEMDCDFSHDPAKLPDLVAATDGAHLALGSRYVPGGGVASWGPLRRVISRVGCWYAQRVLGVEVRDLTGGFKCFRREVLEAIPLDEVSAAGYGFQIEMTYRALLAGYRVVEVPIVFRERRRGHSKMTRRIVWEAAVLVPRLRRRFGRPSAGPQGGLGVLGVEAPHLPPRGDGTRVLPEEDGERPPRGGIVRL